ncbi:Beta-carotene isomerase [Handroanthus impetiginosus]|uniref:Beta-carotene isomerase n=1 Tax=Handroanthus impetiginosus TaxID=429701 RepID=A0A2G9H5Q3_9LAMI|nr:Beta-carotene isomerase [Handroanthus impetiginosus]
MEATLVPPCKSLFLPPRIHGRRVLSMHNPGRFYLVQSVLTDKNNLETSLSSSLSINESKNVYNDNWFDSLAIRHLSGSLQASTGLICNKSGYDGLVEAATMASKCFNTMEQRKLVIKTLETAFPRPILSLIRKLVRPSKFAREYFAVFTTIFFAWLIGPCEVRESEFEGRKEKNIVHVPKCRFLEGTNCVGMCTNLCKMPSQAFIKDSLGMPINMVPSKHFTLCLVLALPNLS